LPIRLSQIGGLFAHPTGSASSSIEPTGKDKSVTKVGKEVYQTPDQAEADVKRLCEESKPTDQPAREPGSAE
jgi:hypothetical protein